MPPLPIRLTPRIFTPAQTAALVKKHKLPPDHWPAFGTGTHFFHSAIKTLTLSDLPDFKARWLSHPDERFLTVGVGYHLHQVHSPTYLSWLRTQKIIPPADTTHPRHTAKTSSPILAAGLWDLLAQHAINSLDTEGLLLTPLLDSLLYFAETQAKNHDIYEEAAVAPVLPKYLDPRFAPYLDKLAARIAGTTDLPSTLALAQASSLTVTSLLARHTTLLGDPRLAIALANALSPSLFQDLLANPSLSSTSKEMFQEWAIMEVVKERITPRVQALTRAMDTAGLHLTSLQRLRLDLLLADPNISKAQLDALAQIPDLVRDPVVRPLLMHRAHSERRYLIMEHSTGAEWLALALQGLKESESKPDGHSNLYRAALGNTTAHNLSGLSRLDLSPWITSASKEYRLIGLHLATFTQGGPKTKPAKLKITRPRSRSY